MIASTSLRRGSIPNWRNGFCMRLPSACAAAKQANRTRTMSNRRYPVRRR
jgi:hypothetical protein